MIKYGQRGPNLALFFLRQGMASNENKESGDGAYSGAKLGSVECGSLMMEKDASGIRKIPFLGQDHSNGRNEALKKC